MMHVFLQLVLLFGLQNAEALSETTETYDYDDIFSKIEDIEASAGKENLLVVFDVDDTLLVIDHCTHNGKPTKGIGKLFNCPSFPTEDDLAARLKALQARGIKTLALTARGSNLIRATQRELARQDMSFLGLPYEQNLEIEVPKKKCKKDEEPPCLSTKKFIDGVMYAQGSHKGTVLKILLEELGDSYSHIVFIDDRKYNVEDMAETYDSSAEITAYLFLYLLHRD